MGTSRCWQDNVVNGFGKRNSKMKVVDRKKLRRMLVRKTVKELKAAGKPVDLQAINHIARDVYGRKRQSQKPKHRV